MIILSIRTDKPEAEIGLFNATDQLSYESWQAHRALAETLHSKIRNMLDDQNVGLNEVEGVVCFRGPGSFTGLRIGLTVANALSNSLVIPVVGTTGDTWIPDGIRKLGQGINEKIVMPEYGADVHITLPKH